MKLIQISVGIIKGGLFNKVLKAIEEISKLDSYEELSNLLNYSI